MARNISTLLREAADRLDSQTGDVDRVVRGEASNRPDAIPPLHPVDAEVGRLFRPYNRSVPPRRTYGIQGRKSFTHTFCCLASKSSLGIPTRNEKEMLRSIGLGEKRLTFHGHDNKSDDFQSFLYKAYPQLASCGGFELLKISGTTRNKDLGVIECPNEGYTIQHLKSPEASVGQAIIYIRPLQLDIDSALMVSENSQPPNGPMVKCVSCHELVQFRLIRTHRENCDRSSTQPADNTDNNEEKSGGSSPGLQQPVTSPGNVCPPADINTDGNEEESGGSSPGLQQPVTRERHRGAGGFSQRNQRPVTRSLTRPLDRVRETGGEARGVSHGNQRPVTRSLTRPSVTERSSSRSSEGHHQPFTRSSIQPLDRDTEVLEEEGSGSLQYSETQAEEQGSQRLEDPVIDLTEHHSSNNDWRLAKTAETAAHSFKQSLLKGHEAEKPLRLHMDLRQDLEEREKSLLCFYKRPNTDWACPFECTLHGDAAVGDGVNRYFLSTAMSKLQYGFELNLGNTGKSILFEGEPGHLIPSTSQIFIESDLFQMAGRMIGHSFLHDGPRLADLCPAIVHVIFGGSPETATVTTQDCADLDIRNTIELLHGNAELTEDQTSEVTDLALSWDLPGPTRANRRWLTDKLLIHAVLGRTSRQVKQ